MESTEVRVLDTIAEQNEPDSRTATSNVNGGRSSECSDPSKAVKRISVSTITEENPAEENVGEKNVDGENIAEADITKENITEESIVENITEENFAEEIIAEYFSEENIADEYIADEDITEKNITEEHIANENITEENITEENVTEENIAEENIHKEIITEENEPNPRMSTPNVDGDQSPECSDSSEVDERILVSSIAEDNESEPRNATPEVDGDQSTGDQSSKCGEPTEGSKRIPVGSIAEDNEPKPRTAIPDADGERSFKCSDSFKVNKRFSVNSIVQSLKERVEEEEEEEEEDEDEDEDEEEGNVSTVVSSPRVHWDLDQLPEPQRREDAIVSSSSSAYSEDEGEAPTVEPTRCVRCHACGSRLSPASPEVDVQIPSSFSSSVVPEPSTENSDNAEGFRYWDRMMRYGSWAVPPARVKPSRQPRRVPCSEQLAQRAREDSMLSDEQSVTPGYGRSYASPRPMSMQTNDTSFGSPSSPSYERDGAWDLRTSTRNSSVRSLRDEDAEPRRLPTQNPTSASYERASSWDVRASTGNSSVSIVRYEDTEPRPPPTHVAGLSSIRSYEQGWTEYLDVSRNGDHCSWLPQFEPEATEHSNPKAKAKRKRARKACRKVWSGVCDAARFVFGLPPRHMTKGKLPVKKETEAVDQVLKLASAERQGR